MKEAQFPLLLLIHPDICTIVKKMKVSLASDSPNYFAQRQAAADYCHVPLNPLRRRDRHRCILLLVLLQSKTLQLELQIQGLGK
jgi:hypothetical protein